MVGSLRIELAAEQPDRKASLIDSAEKNFNTTLPLIYKKAVIGNNSNAYSGADIWKYFNEDLDDDLEKDAQNTLFIITDGYMDLEKSEERPAQNNRFASCSQIINALRKYPDWENKFTEGDYGILPIGKKFANLRVVLLQVNPKDDWNGEYSLLTKIWGKWFNEMGINTYSFIKDDNINEVRESVEKFMQVKIAGRIEPVQWTKITEKDSSLSAVPASNKDKNEPLTFVNNTVTAPEKKTVPVVSKPVTHSNKDVLPPDETEADFLSVKKKDKPLVNNNPVNTAKDDSDILKDGTPTKGFNTGIKKNMKKKNR
jgi:hypothetical protein